jgi:Tfp pilus assembly protein PilV
MLKLNQKGDTIVEVLISMGVIATVLGAAYGISNRSLRIGRLSQERVEAVKLLETQLETLKSRVKTAKGDITKAPELNSATDFCYNAGVFSASSTCLNINGLYNVRVTKGSNDVFAARAEWISQSGVSSSSELVYRINKDSY